MRKTTEQQSFQPTGADQIAKTVRSHRKRSRLTQQELARLAGVGKTVVYDIEKGKSTIQLDTLLKVLKVLNIRLSIESPLMEALARESHENR